MRAVGTARKTLAHVSVCVGCCCGQTEKGHPAVPVTWLKEQWKARRLNKHVQLTISGCLGPCDLSNVVSIGSVLGTTWIGGLETQHEYDQLLDWASRTAQQQRVLPLPAALTACVFDRFRDAAVAVTSARP